MVLLSPRSASIINHGNGLLFLCPLCRVAHAPSGLLLVELSASPFRSTSLIPFTYLFSFLPHRDYHTVICSDIFMPTASVFAQILDLFRYD